MASERDWPRDGEPGLRGAYLVSIETAGRRPILGEIVAGTTRLSPAGRIVKDAWCAAARVHARLQLDAFAIMPDQLHAILWLLAGHGPGLTEIVSGFKSFSARRVNLQAGTRGDPVWQQESRERPIASDDALQALRFYLVHEPARWLGRG